MSGDGNEVNRIRTAVRIRPLSKSEEVNEEKMIASVDFESGKFYPFALCNISFGGEMPREEIYAKDVLFLCLHCFLIPC